MDINLKIVFAQVENARYADVHRNLSAGWSSHVPEHELDYQQLPIQEKPFQLELKDGVVSTIKIE